MDILTKTGQLALQESRVGRIAQTAAKIYDGGPESYERFVDAVKDAEGRVNGSALLDIDSPVKCAVWGSGTFLTGAYELQQWREAKKTLGFSPVDYVAIVSNNAKSNAASVADQFRLPLVQIDFTEWYRANIDRHSEKPTSETGLFFPPGTELPENISERFRIRKEFEQVLAEKLARICPDVDSQSLRGYNFPIINIAGQIDDTHPADLSVLADGKPKYPGWQDRATQMMLDDKLPRLRSSLIAVEPLKVVDNLRAVDTGTLLALSNGLVYEGNDGKEAQGIMKATEDAQLTALKAWGLFPIAWIRTLHHADVTYNTPAEEETAVSEPAIHVLLHQKSGRDAFGRRLPGDLEQLAEDFQRYLRKKEK